MPHSASSISSRRSATANSAVAAVDRLKERGANDIRLVSLIAAPEGVERMRGIHPDVPIWLAAIDQGLDANAYILPGLGDAGDRDQPQVQRQYRVGLTALRDHLGDVLRSLHSIAGDVDDAGAWQLVLDGQRVTLRSDRNTTTTFGIRNPDTLRLLDKNGQEIESKLNYDLKRAAVYAPIEPAHQ